MSEGNPDFAAPHHIGSRDVQLRSGSKNARESSGVGTVAYGLDDGMIVEFFEQQVHMEYLSKTTGHQIFQGRIFTRIVMPGNRNTVWVHETKGVTYEMLLDDESGEYHTSWDILEQCENGDVPEPNKYPNAWARFMRKGISTDVGMPIEQWGAITRSYAESLKANHIHSVEALAGLSDLQCQNIMGAVKYRDLAKAHLNETARTTILAREQERATAAEERNAILAKQLEALQQHVMTLQNRLAGMQTPEPAGRVMSATAQIAAELPKFNEIKKVSVADAKKKHKIPPREGSQAA